MRFALYEWGIIIISMTLRKRKSSLKMQMLQTAIIADLERCLWVISDGRKLEVLLENMSGALVRLTAECRMTSRWTIVNLFVTCKNFVSHLLVRKRTDQAFGFSFHCKKNRFLFHLYSVILICNTLFILEFLIFLFVFDFFHNPVWKRMYKRFPPKF